MASRHGGKKKGAKVNVPRVRRWKAHGFTRGVITLPNGPLDLGGGWTLYPVNDAARSREPYLILESRNAMVQVGNPHDWPSLGLTGIVEAMNREEALRVAEEEMDALIGLLVLATTGTFDEVTGVSVALADSGRDAELQVSFNQAPAVPITAAEIENMTRLYGWWRSVPNQASRAAIRRSIAWYRYGASMSQHALRNSVLWSAAEALAHAFPAPKSQRQCEHCSRPLACQHCGQPSFRTEPYVPVKTLLVERYEVMSKKEFDQFSKGRSGMAHGGYGPKERPAPTMPWLAALHGVIVQALRDLAAEV